jgi:hypothetical protein
MELRCILKSIEEDDFWNRTRFNQREKSNPNVCKYVWRLI